MSTIHATKSAGVTALQLGNGDQATQVEFHRWYEQMPQDSKAELIGGIVYVAPPLSAQHGEHHVPLASLFFLYETHTPGVRCADNATILLADDAEPQPDLLLRILPEYGGRASLTATGFIQGPPELVAEIALSSRAIDLHAKRHDYAAAGVEEYLVVSVHEHKVYWFDLRTDALQPVGDDGIIRLRSFPGLWVDQSALFARDGQKLMATLMTGLASPEHAAFVSRLAQMRR